MVRVAQLSEMSRMLITLKAFMYGFPSMLVGGLSGKHDSASGRLERKWVLQRCVLGSQKTFPRAYSILGPGGRHALVPGSGVSKPDTGRGVNTSSQYTVIWTLGLHLHWGQAKWTCVDMVAGDTLISSVFLKSVLSALFWPYCLFYYLLTIFISIDSLKKKQHLNLV